MAQYVWHKTNHKGLRYREHPTRKHGIKKDRFYQYRIMIDGRRIQESFGWTSEGWTEEKCLVEIAKLKQARRTGEGEATLKERRQKAEAKRVEKERQALTFNDVWGKNYLPQAKADRGDDALIREESIYTLWIKPVLGDKPVVEIAPVHLEKIKSNMKKGGKAARTIQYTLAIIRQVFNHAKRNDLFNGDNPVKKVKMPSEDNRRTRFLSRAEADALLEKIKFISPDVYDMSLLSLHTGMRAGEIFSLTWGAVDLANGTLTLKNTKNGRTRAAYLTNQAKQMLQARRPVNPGPDQLVFPDRRGQKMKQVSNTFNRAIDKLKLNEGVTDPRDKVVFHTLRHTFASWLVMAGTDLYVVKELLGHSDFKMTSRYAHLGENTLQAAVNNLGTSFDTQKTEAAVVKNGAEVVALATSE
ncbi:MAG: site-specific integrase [Desulfobacteraceae bacterium]